MTNVSVLPRPEIQNAGWAQGCTCGEWGQVLSFPLATRWLSPLSQVFSVLWEKLRKWARKRRIVCSGKGQPKTLSQKRYVMSRPHIEECGLFKAKT